MAEVYKCDRCGAEAATKRVFKRHYRRPVLSRGSWDQYSWDICPSCYQDIIDYMKGKPLWTEDDARKMNELERLLKEEKEVTARWERIHREQQELKKDG